jgi:hypothetical protein
MGLHRLAGLTCDVELAPDGSAGRASSALRWPGAEAREARAEAACHHSEVSEDKESLSKINPLTRIESDILQL